MDTPEPELTVLLNHAQSGDKQSEGIVYEQVYGELRRLAHGAIRPGGGLSVQVTGLVHDVWLKLAGKDSPWESRGHYFGVVAKAMRSILVDHLRARRAQKRKGGQAMTLDGIVDAAAERDTDLLELDAALEEFAAVDERAARVVELRFFAGLTIPDVARVLETSHATVERDWVCAKAWLKRALGSAPD